MGDRSMFTRGTNACTLGAQFAPTFHRPFLRYVEGEQGGDGGGDDSAPKFPANTPVKDMTPEQQVAYWQDKARKHEDRVKAFGDYTPDKVKALETEYSNLKTSGQSDADKAIEAAREEGRNEVRATLNRERATNSLEKALQGRVPNAGALLGLDVNKFIVNGQVDADAVKAWVEDHSEEAPTGARKPADLGQGRRGSGDAGAAKTVSAGRDLFAERQKKKTTTS
jgi:hypothetical protein